MKSETQVLALVGCSKHKTPNSEKGKFVPAENLYQSQLFRARVDHVTNRKLPWFVLSAKFGLVAPQTPIPKYDHRMEEKNQLDFSAWHIGVVRNLIDTLYDEFNIRDLRTVRIEIHAGRKYSQPLDVILRSVGFYVIRPVESMGIGQQLRYYAVWKGGEA